jgi:protein-S-isoprenylcysteine O-methyltransferase
MPGSGLDALFERLMAASPSPYPTPSSIVKDPVTVAATPAADVTPTRAPKTTVLQSGGKDVSHAEDSPVKLDLSLDDLETQYLQKALAYLQKLPGHQDTPAALAQSAAKKLQGLSTSTVVAAPPMDAESLKQKYAEAVVGYLAGLDAHGKKIPGNQAIISILEECDANLFYLCSRLVDTGVLSIEDNLDEVNGLCRSLLEAGTIEGSPQETSSDSVKKPVSYDPMDKVEAWPSQEKRENGT